MYDSHSRLKNIYSLAAVKQLRNNLAAIFRLVAKGCFVADHVSLQNIVLYFFDVLLSKDVNEWTSKKCSGKESYTQNIPC